MHKAMHTPATPYDGQRVALVTGAGRGLGAEICRALAADGWSIAVVDKDREFARQVAEPLPVFDVESIALDGNVSDEADVERIIGRTLERFGRLDGLVNNAGTDTTLPVESLTVADWHRVIGTNLTGPFLMAKAALPHLRRQRGSVVNIVSTAARRAWPNASAYHASKWGLLGLSHALHAEWRGAGIKVTAIIAGGMKTGFLLDRFPDLDPDLLQDPAIVARAVAFAMAQPEQSVIPEMMVLPMKETSWP